MFVILQCLIFFLLSSSVYSESSRRSFSIDFDQNTFVKDGKPFRYISGSMHYSRIPFHYWEDRLRKMYAAGLNAIQVYVPWNVHQPERDQFDFQGQNDLVRFIKLADKVGLLVILRAGPYICAEWDYGGFPYWIKRDDQSILLRSMDPGYIKPVTKYFSVLLPKIKPFLYQNGGPIIMIQIENEYGSYSAAPCDHKYMTYLRDMFRFYLGSEVVLFTTDGSGTNFLRCGTVEGAYATVDFGPGNASQGFAPMREWNPKGPLVNSEFYTGWLDYWNGSWARVSSKTIINTLKDMLDMGANVNFYMFEGGTNFGYTNGADPPFRPVVTSYDYDAPLNEAGDTTLKYLAIRSQIKQYKTVPPDIPPNTTKEEFGIINMKKVASVTDALSILSPQGCIKTKYPITMEQARQPFGFALYRTLVPDDLFEAKLNLAAVRDRAYVMLDGVLVGKVYRNSPPMFLSLTGHQGQTLDILVENMGRINFGREINNNQKGLIANVTVNNTTLTSWKYYSIDLLKAFNGIKHRGDTARFEPGYVISQVTNMSVPVLYSGSFVLKMGQVPADTYLNVCGWKKGQALINGFNLGRYWPTEGPQVTLFVPGIYIKPYPFSNFIVLFELEGAPPDCHSTVVRHYGNLSGCSVTLQKTSLLGTKCSQNGIYTASEEELRDNIAMTRYQRDIQVNLEIGD